jgi:membrane protein
MGAALAYYTIFAVAPLLIVAITVSGLLIGQSQARSELFNQINQLVGKEGGQAIQSLVIAAANRKIVGIWSTIGALGTLAAGAMGFFVELQDSLNTIWGVERKTGCTLKYFIKDRRLSFGMVLGIGFLLLASLVLNTAISAVGKFATGPWLEHSWIWSGVNFVVSLGVITLLFAMILKVLPDARIAWSDVWFGAFVTAFLFNLGKHVIGTYLGRSSMVSVYGAAGSFIVLLIWVYYSSQLLFFGAELTRVYARRRHPILPKTSDVECPSPNGLQTKPAR